MLSPLVKEFDGMTWKESERKLEAECIRFAFDTDWSMRQIFQTVQTHGIEAGTATLCAVAFIEENGPAKTAREALDIYQGISKNASPWARERLEDLEYWAAWVVNKGPTYKTRWPVQPMRTENPDKKGGLANIMLMLSVLGLAEEGTNTSTILASAIDRFLKEGMGRKSKRKQGKRCRIEEEGAPCQET